ncbi:hypothetical protein E2C01_042177 [Portunus trituberculatus]|uniref:Uncharacterized protein n=1 Tax=Portunus trituberculatus TaxID=210409 RepID=A0A5B7FSX4_PORTR|nr:hypothetical protein [Portunus trituberculatus]
MRSASSPSVLLDPPTERELDMLMAGLIVLEGWCLDLGAQPWVAWVFCVDARCFVAYVLGGISMKTSEAAAAAALYLP